MTQFSWRPLRNFVMRTMVQLIALLLVSVVEIYIILIPLCWQACNVLGELWNIYNRNMLQGSWAFRLGFNACFGGVCQEAHNTWSAVTETLAISATVVSSLNPSKHRGRWFSARIRTGSLADAFNFSLIFLNRFQRRWRGCWWQLRLICRGVAVPGIEEDADIRIIRWITMGLEFWLLPQIRSEAKFNLKLKQRSYTRCYYKSST